MSEEQQIFDVCQFFIYCFIILIKYNKKERELCLNLFSLNFSFDK